MNDLWVIVSTALGATALACLILDRFFGGDRRIERRIHERQREMYAGSSESSLLFRESRLMEQGRHQVRTWLREFVEQAGLSIPISRLLLASGVFSAVMAAILSQIPYRWAVVPVGAVIGAAAPWMAVSRRRHRRVETFRRQLPDALDSMARALQAGQSVPSALQIVSNECRAPLAREFACVCEQQNLGLSFDASLQELSRRIPIVELRILAIALIVQRQAGGNPIEIISNMSDLVRKRLRLADRVRALTGEGRMQAIVLTLLPVIAFLGLLVGRPDYIRPLIDRPRMLTGLMAAQMIATIWIRRIVRTSY